MLVSLGTMSWKCQKQSNKGSVSLLLFFKLFTASAKLVSQGKINILLYRWRCPRDEIPAQQEQIQELKFTTFLLLTFPNSITNISVLEMC